MAYETRYDTGPQQRYHYDDGDPSARAEAHRADGLRSDPFRSVTHTSDQERRDVARMVAIRNAVLLRMREMNSRHGMHAFDLRNGANALGPHALAFLYRDIGYEQDRPPHDVVRAATRLFRDSEEVRDLPELLRTLSNISRQYVQRGGFDPRTVMAHRSDVMSTQAQFIGVGVSSLDTLAGEWSDLRQRANSALEVPGRSYVHLVDGTRMILDRGGQFGVVGVTYSSAPLEVGQGISFTSWRPLHRRPGEYGEPVWAGLEMLLQEVWQGTDLMASPVRRHR